MSSKFEMMGNGEVHVDKKSLSVMGISAIACASTGFLVEAFNSSGHPMEFVDMMLLEGPQIYVMKLRPAKKGTTIDWGKNPLPEHKHRAVIAELPDGTRLPIVTGSALFPIENAITIRCHN